MIIDEGFAFQYLLQQSEEALIHTNSTCVCAPMMGMFVQLMTMVMTNRSDAAKGTSYLHMFNPSIRLGDAKKLVKETQRKFLPLEDEFVKNVRSTNITVTFQSKGESCAERSIAVRGHRAYCIQQCADLLQGITVYKKATFRNV